MFIRIALAALVLFLPAPGAGGAQEIPQTRQQVSLSFAPVVKKVSPAVINIYTKRTVSKRMHHPFFDDPFFAPLFGNSPFGNRMRRQVESSLGSGVIVEPGGLAVTNAHVIKGAEEITAILNDGREFAAEIALYDEASDLALLRLDTKDKTLPFVSLKPSESLQVGDLVLAVGNPFGVGQTVTSGIVSAQGRSSLDINDFNFFIQTDAAINPGNSGGPLVALDGGVVGINTAIYSRSGGSLGIGFAIPSEMVASVIAAEKSGRSGAGGVVRPWLGVSAQSVSSDIAESLDLKRPQGALIAGLHPASPLKKAGIKTGDIVFSIDGKPVRDPFEMKFRMATVPLGNMAGVEILRDGQQRTFQVRAIAPPEEPPRNQIRLKGRTHLSGAVIANLNPAVSTELGLRGEKGGVAVIDVEPASPAARIVARGDILREINGHEIQETRDVEKALKAMAGLALIMERGGHTRQIIIR